MKYVEWIREEDKEKNEGKMGIKVHRQVVFKK